MSLSEQRLQSIEDRLPGEVFPNSVEHDVLILLDEVRRLQAAWSMADPVLTERDALFAEVKRLRDGIEALCSRWRGSTNPALHMERDLRALLNPPTEGCNCGFGGFHDDVNPRCRLNPPTEGGSDA